MYVWNGRKSVACGEECTGRSVKYTMTPFSSCMRDIPNVVALQSHMHTHESIMHVCECACMSVS